MTKKPKETKECCKNCRAGRYFSEEWVTRLAATVEYGICCKNPPVITDTNFWGRFPPVRPTGWCDKWKPKTKGNGDINPWNYIAPDGPNDLRTVIERLRDDIADSSHSVYHFNLAATLERILEQTKND